MSAMADRWASFRYRSDGGNLRFISSRSLRLALSSLSNFYTPLTVSLHHRGALANDSYFRTWKRQADDSKPDLRAKNAGGGKLDVIGLVPSAETAWKPTLSASLSTRQVKGVQRRVI